MAGISATQYPQSKDDYPVRLIFDDDSDNTASTDGDRGPTWLHSVLMVSADAGAHYLKIYDNRNPTIGTTGEDIQVPVSGSGTDYSLVCPLGLFFESGISWALDATANNGGPTSATAGDVRLVTTGGFGFVANTAERLAVKLAQTDIAVVSVPAALGSTTSFQSQATSSYKAVGSGAKTVYSVTIDNRANPNQKAYLQMYNAAAPTVGTDATLMSLFAPRGRVAQYVFPEGIAFGSALTYAVTDTAGRGSTTNPSNPVAVAISA